MQLCGRIFKKMPPIPFCPHPAPKSLYKGEPLCFFWNCPILSFPWFSQLHTFSIFLSCAFFGIVLFSNFSTTCTFSHFLIFRFLPFASFCNFSLEFFCHLHLLEFSIFLISHIWLSFGFIFVFHERTQEMSYIWLWRGVRYCAQCGCNVLAKFWRLVGCFKRLDW